MNDREFIEYVKSIHFDSACQSIEDTGQYWCSMVRQEMRTLANILIQHGLDVIAYEVPPIWDTVIAKSNIPYDFLKEIARQRAIDSGHIDLEGLSS